MAVLTLFSSSPGTGKTTRCIEIFKSKILESNSGIDSRSFFILPSREHAERIRNLVLKQDVPGLFNAHILTINNFISRLLSGAHASGPSDAVRKRILRELLQEDREGLGYFDKVKDFPGFHEMLVDTLKEFKSGLLDIPEFERRSQALIKEPAFRAKFKSFTVLIKRYEEALLKAHLEEPEDNVVKLLERGPKEFPADLVIFDGFYHFTRAQRSFIAYLSTRAQRVVTTLTLPANAKNRPQVFDYPMQTRRFLMSLGFREAKISDRTYRTADTSLMHLEKNLFLESPSTAANGSVTLIEAQSPRGEMEIIAREIRRLYRETDIHYSDICVIFRKIGSTRQLIKSVFEEFDIPVIVHEREKLSEQGLGIVIYRFLSLIEEDWSREDLLHLLRSSYLKNHFSPDAAQKLESAAFRANVMGGREGWKALLTGMEAEPAQAIHTIMKWEAALLGAASAGEFIKKILKLIDLWETGEDPEALRAIEEVLKNSERFYRGAKDFSPAVFINELKDSLKSALFSLKPRGRNRVQVYDIIMAMPKEYKVVFMAGLLEKSFPQAVSEDPLFKDDERRRLNGKDPVLDERRRRASGERYFFYMGLSRARERLYLSHPRYDAEGKPTLKSFFIDEVKKCFLGLPEIIKDVSDNVPLWNEWESERDMVTGLSSVLFSPAPAGRRQPAPILKALEMFSSRAGFREVLRAGFSDPAAVIRDEKIKLIFGEKKGPFSATRLEMFATCAFKYFSARVLKLEEPAEGAEFRQMGDLLHKILEEFYQETPEAERNQRRFWENEEEVFRRLSEKLAAKMEQGPLSYLPLFRRKIYEERMRRALRLFAAYENETADARKLVPSYFEHAFENLKIGEGADAVIVEGKIDRVDIDPETQKALVIDYKSSKRPVTIRKKLSEGLELQIPIYLLAARRLLGLDVAGGELRYLNTATSEGLYRESEKSLLGLSPHKAALSDEEFEAILSESERRILEYAKRLRSGDISVKSKSCKYCSFSPVCRFETWRLVYSDDE